MPKSGALAADQCSNVPLGTPQRSNTEDTHRWRKSVCGIRRFDEEVLTGADAPDSATTHGPIAEYDARVESGRLRDDEHQRSTE